MLKQKPNVEKLKKKLLSIDEVGAVLGTSSTTVRSLIKHGYIKCLMFGNSYKIYEFELDNFIIEYQGQQLVLKDKKIFWKEIEGVS
ncbi:Helix-turn-helix domain protein [Bacillus subtilis]|nr:Helix-turn-helix domain protein [Bacillus subtilis]